VSDSTGSGGADPRIGIFGAGAIGTLLAALLTRAGLDVAVVARPAHAAAIAADGIQVTGVEGAWTAAVAASAEPRSLAGRDLVLACVKVPDTDAAVAAFEGDAATFVTVQNGLAGHRQAHAALGERAVACIASSGATLLGPGQVEWSSTGFLTVGALGGPNSRASAVHAVLSRALDVDLTDDIEGALWAKVLVNIDLPILALCGAEFPDGLRDPEVQWLEQRATTEAQAVMDAAGIEYPPGRMRDALAGKRQLIELDRPALLAALDEVTVRIVPSSLQSVRRGSPQEIDSVNGAVAELGRELGVPAPCNAELTRLSRAMEQPGFEYHTPAGLKAAVERAMDVAEASRP
jgi:2-dehydropantoate 2-reductase